jgi:hypothetical protein
MNGRRRNNWYLGAAITFACAIGPQGDSAYGAIDLAGSLVSAHDTKERYEKGAHHLVVQIPRARCAGRSDKCALAKSRIHENLTDLVLAIPKV